MSRKKRRSFTREFKLSALARMATTDNIVGLADELGIERKLLYCWRDQYQSGGSAALRRAGRPRHDPSTDIDIAGAAVDEDDATQARRRIEALERKIGQQQLDLDFFREALRHVREQRRKQDGPGGTASTR